MNKELTKKLFNKFDFFKPEHSPTRGLMRFGFACGDGWYNLILNLCNKIKEQIDKHPELYKDFEVLQVKEKFGGLRFYTNFYYEKMGSLIDKACKKSYRICEICGKPGSHYARGTWLKTACAKCAKEKGYKKVK